jgi:serralysin
MADGNYDVVPLTTSGDRTITDDGTGIDQIYFIDAVFSQPAEIRLGWTVVSGVSTSASAFYFNAQGAGIRLVVNGQIENARGSNGRDFVSGNELDNELWGDQNQIERGGDDTVSGGLGNDTLIGGVGADLLDGGGDDDLIYGDEGADTISGGAGVDTILGDTGADSLSGGGDLGDTINYVFSDARVVVKITFGTVTTGRGGDAQGDRLSGFTDVIGSSLDDVLTDTVKREVAFGGNANLFDGAFGNDKLVLGGGNDTGKGGEGNDTIIGGAGADKLYGGLDADRFVFRATNESKAGAAGRDVIFDFSHAEGDEIDLRGIDAVAGGANNAFTFIGSASFSGAAGELRFETTANGIIVQGNVNAGTAPDFSVLLRGVSVIEAGDFLL